MKTSLPITVRLFLSYKTDVALSGGGIAVIRTFHAPSIEPLHGLIPRQVPFPEEAGVAKTVLQYD